MLGSRRMSTLEDTVAYAIITEVEFSNDDLDVSRRLLSDGLIPAAKSLPGFQSGLWTRAGRKGIGTIVFDTEDNAVAGQAALDANRPAEAPKITQSGIYEVMGQA
jgi:hypothetical protein